MPPSARFGKEEIVQAALQIVREGGIAQLSARNVAEKMGASTAPIYSCFPSMDELAKAVYVVANERMIEYMAHPWTSAPFLNMGIGMTLLARDEPNLYKMLNFETPPYEFIPQEVQERYLELMANDPLFVEMPREQLKSLLQKMSIVTHGLAAYICTGQICDVTAEWVANWLAEVGGAVIADAFRSLGLSAPDKIASTESIILNDTPPQQRSF
ncbi:MAG: helix-turn-helix domain-containing protein [bacterium]